MPSTDFSHVDQWVFDLDNTLYPPQMRLFDQIETRMSAYIMRVSGVDRAGADALRHRWWSRYGTTLAGLMTHHDIDPDHFLEDVHDISFDPLTADPMLLAQIRALPGRKIVYTNGSVPYAKQVLRARALEGAFDAIYGVEDADYVPKPQAKAFEQVFAKDGLDPSRGAMFEDDPRNLQAPHQMGMRTVLVGPDPVAEPHIHHHTDQLTAFLERLNA